MKTVYLCGAIFGQADTAAKGWRDEATALLVDRFVVRDPMARDYRGRESENVTAIVEGDLADIAASDVLLVHAHSPSWGTAMEIKAAHDMGKTIYVFGAPTPCSPWLSYHATCLFDSVHEAIDAARAETGEAA